MRYITVLSMLAILLVTAATNISLATAGQSSATVDHLRCEYRENPLGIDVLQPRLFWKMKDSRRGAVQTAYQILVADSVEKLAAGEGNLWDTGRVQSDRSIQVVYKGKPLTSRMHCHWKVRIWDADGKASEYSRPAMWTMGLLNPEDVKAQWIGTGQPLEHPSKKIAENFADVKFDGCNWVWHDEPGVDARKAAKTGEWYFRKDITLPSDRQLVSAKFLMGADNSGNMFINNHRVVVVGGFGFKAGQTADITALLLPGNNHLAISAQNVGEGPNPAGLIGKLVISFTEGKPMIVPIDKTWKSAPAPLENWKTCKLDAKKWRPVAVIGKYGEGPWGKIDSKKVLIRGCPQLRKQFKIDGPIRRATVYASALGLYKLHLNGKKVGKDYFTPGWTDYKKRVYYNTYDVTDMVQAGGKNAIGAELAAGWYAGAVGWQKHGHIYGTLCKLFVQLEIELADGSIKTVCSDPTWKYAYGPLIEGEFLPGETYDARLETPGWNTSAFDDSAWKPVVATKKVEAKLEGYMGVPVRETGELKPQKITQPVPGKFVFDLGQNFAGFARLKVKGPAGTRVSIRFAEMLNPDGTLYTTNLRGARCIDSYVLKGDGKEEIWQPQFTFHGFRYVEVSGYPGTPTADAVTGVAINSNTPLVGSFACSSPMVNQLYSNIVWTQRANFIEVPTDCPQRDERLGWTGDAQVFIRAAAYNADVGAFYTKWLIDVEDAQRPDGGFTDIVPFIGCGWGTAGWADAGTICPWAIYTVYDDHRVLKDRYQSMVRFVDYCKKHSKDLIRPAKGYGDWLSIKADTPKEVMATAYFARSVKLTANAARVLGKTEDAKKYDALFEDIKAAFNKAFVAPDGRIKGNTQTVYVLAIWFGLLSDEHEKAATRYLVEDIKSRGNHLSTGFNGTAYLMPTLAKTGNNDTAYKLLLNDTFPSWGYSIKHGATSIWERWDGWTADKGFQDPGMNSFAHYSFGAVARWMFQSVAGIGTDGPGFKRLMIAPCPGPGLKWVKAGYDSIHGPIQSDWRIDNGKLNMDVTIPANTTATVVVPHGNPKEITEGGRPLNDSNGVKIVSATDGEVVLNVGAGKYSFCAPWKP
ncbi:MAG: family 78 glycoside hydrolase catalytic domain [Pirellulales bacterium]|nr:family 78 glycoside hydrolase catalytic domain [Pirellulales bacterium]